MASSDSTDQPPLCDHLMELTFSYGGEILPPMKDLPGDYDFVSTPTLSNHRCIHPDETSLARVLDDLFSAKRIPPVRSGRSRGIREAETFLSEVPWGGGTSNSTEVRSGDRLVATFRAMFRPMEIVPSAFTIDRGDGQTTTFTTSEKDPYMLVNSQQAIVYPEASMERGLGRVYYSHRHPDMARASDWVSGKECLDTFKKAVKAQIGQETEVRSVLYNVDGETQTVLSYRGP